MVYLLKYSQFKFEGLGLHISNPRPSDSNWLYFNIKGGTHPTLISIYAVPLFFIYSCKYNAKWSMYKIASFQSPKEIVRRNILRWLHPTKPKSDNIYQFIFCCSVPVCFLHNATRLINGVSSLCLLGAPQTICHTIAVRCLVRVHACCQSMGIVCVLGYLELPLVNVVNAL